MELFPLKIYINASEKSDLSRRKLFQSAVFQINQEYKIFRLSQIISLCDIALCIKDIYEKLDVQTRSVVFSVFSTV